MKLVDPQAKILHTISPPLIMPAAERKELFKELVALMHAEQGVGLAAPQVGLLHRCFVMIDNEGRDRFIADPEITESSTHQVMMTEGCLSYPDVYLDILRAESVNLKYTDENDAVVHGEFTGMAGRIVQHELDHLNGRCFVDLVSKLKLDMAKKKAQKRNRKNG